MTPELIRIIDDDESFLRAISRLLKASGFSVKTYSTPEAFMAAPEPDAPGCILVDLQMPGMTGLDLQEALASAGNQTPIVFISGQGDIPTTVQAMRRGAEDFLTKRAPKEDIISAVKRAFERDAQKRCERSRLSGLRSRFATLTDREIQVLKIVVQGKMNKEIASDLGIHERTVKLHRTSITTKVGVNSTAELTKLWMEAGGDK